MDVTFLQIALDAQQHNTPQKAALPALQGAPTWPVLYLILMKWLHNSSWSYVIFHSFACIFNRQAIDPDSRGVVDFPEFLAAMARPMREYDDKEALRKAWEVMDKDKVRPMSIHCFEFTPFAVWNNALRCLCWLLYVAAQAMKGM